MVTLRRRETHRGEAVAAVIFPDGMLRKIPAWMLEPSTAQLDVHEPPRFSKESLDDLRRVLDVALSLLDDAAIASTCRDGDAA